jgi:two-component system chemotaxis sensor kinase CheA
MDDLIVEFLTETNESLGELDLDLVNLEQNPNDKELLSNIFRLMHTIKGTCGFLGLPRLETVAHRAENVLGKFRDGKLEVTPYYVTLIFESLDVIRHIVSEMEETGSEPDGDDSELIEKLDAVYEGRDSGNGDITPKDGGGTALNASGEKDADADMVPSDDGVAFIEDTPYIDAETGEPIDFEPVPAPSLQAQKEADVVNEGSGETTTQASSEEQQPAPAPSAPEKKEKTQAKPAGDDGDDAKTSGKPLTNQTLRVNVDVLENLMTMVSELVLTRNQLLQILRTQNDSEFASPLQNLNHAVSELQEGVMKTRMQPVGNAWSKLPRIIRDLSMELGKKIDLVMKGKETELDKQVLEMIKDPLTHMVRNSGDHGIETPAERLAAGKEETGTIILNAYHEGGHIVIEISDDGKGLNTAKIKEKILANGLVSADELEEMQDHHIHQFIFNAGLSTAEKVTSVSGRGVGMDVVKTNIEKIGGSIELKSEEGKGSTFYIKIPLTLAIVSAMIVESAGEKFAIPQLAVQELVLVSERDATKIETIKGSPFFRLRDKLLPLVTLSEILKLDRPKSSVSVAPVASASPPVSEELEEDGETAVVEPETPEVFEQMVSEESSMGQYIVVTNVGSSSFGVIVDKVFDMEEIVVKPVASIFKDLNLFSGNTILGDGNVIMILDPAGISSASGEATSSEAVDDEAEAVVGGASQDKTAMLLFSVGDETPKALPLSVISRLEEIDLSDVEHTGTHSVIQYDGKLMPLIPFDSSTDLKGEGKKPIMVFEDEDSAMGLVVDKILDITEEYIDMQLMDTKDHLVGSTIIEGKATDVIDLGFYLKKASSNWFKQRTGHGDEDFIGGDADIASKRVLLVDDSQFFRNMIAPLLRSVGYDVDVSNDPVEALSLRETGRKYDVIVSDIEMPQMNGFEFAQEVNSEGSSWKNVPMIAMTSHATPNDIKRGEECGFKQYIAKFDRDTLLDTMRKTLGSQAGDTA